MTVKLMPLDGKSGIPKYMFTSTNGGTAVTVDHHFQSNHARRVAGQIRQDHQRYFEMLDTQLKQNQTRKIVKEACVGAVIEIQKDGERSEIIGESSSKKSWKLTGEQNYVLKCDEGKVGWLYCITKDSKKSHSTWSSYF